MQLTKQLTVFSKLLPCSVSLFVFWKQYSQRLHLSKKYCAIVYKIQDQNFSLLNYTFLRLKLHVFKWQHGKKKSICNAGASGDMNLISGSGRSPGGEHSNPIQFFCLGNPMDRGAWWVAVHRATKSQTQPKWLSTVY